MFCHWFHLSSSWKMSLKAFFRSKPQLICPWTLHNSEQLLLSGVSDILWISKIDNTDLSSFGALINLPEYKNRTRQKKYLKDSQNQIKLESKCWMADHKKSNSKARINWNIVIKYKLFSPKQPSNEATGSNKNNGNNSVTHSILISMILYQICLLDLLLTRQFDKEFHARVLPYLRRLLLIKLFREVIYFEIKNMGAMIKKKYRVKSL